MAHAFVVNVNLEGRRLEDLERMLNDQVIPMMKQLAGFERGLWLRSEDGSTGMAIVVFDSEEHARTAHDGLGAIRPADAPPITGSAIYGVTALA